MTKSETQTRSELIDKQLASAGWNVKDPTQVVEEFDILTSELFITDFRVGFNRHNY